MGKNWLPTAIADAEDAIATMVEASLMGKHLSRNYSELHVRAYCGRLLPEGMFATPIHEESTLCAACVKARDES